MPRRSGPQKAASNRNVYIRDPAKLKRILEIWEAQNGESFSSWVHEMMNRYLEEHDNENDNK
jgi:hypothetical protein